MTEAAANGYSLDDSHLIRQCRDWQVVNGLPTFEAFLFPQGKHTLSFSWLEKICVELGVEPNIDTAISELEKSPPLAPEPGFMWAVLSVEEINWSVKEGTGTLPKIEPDPTENDPTHVLVWGWKHCSRKVRKKVAQYLASKLTAHNTRDWPVTPQD